ncbi:olfactory receptor 2A12-like [Stigmatopora nigra]
MENSSYIASIVLSAYCNMGKLNYLYFSILLVWYTTICVTNSFIIAIIFVNRKLHEPMYMLLCNLMVNEINGSTSLYPLMLSQMFSHSHDVPVSWCFLQMFWIYSSASVEFCSLAAMAYDRYVAICKPLQYNLIMNTARVAVIVLFIWVYSYTVFLLAFVFVVNLKLCGNVVHQLFCDYYLVAKLVCSVSINNARADFYAVLTTAVPFGLILVSYIQILIVCFKTSKENKKKAIMTCTPQVISVSNLFVGVFFKILETRVDAGDFPDNVRFFFSIYLLVFQPAITPFMYGLNLPQIRQACKRFLWHKRGISF